MTPKISYLIATKNRGYIIKDTIDSLMFQDISDWEAIIVDDHGKDNTQEIIEKYKDNRLRYFRLNDTHGLGSGCARNFGAVFALADIIAILDSDDIAYPSRSKITLEAFKKNPDADVFYGGLDIWEEKTGQIRERKTPVYDYSYDRIKKLHFIPHPTVAVRKQVLLDNPYNQYFIIAEDYDWLSRLAKQGKKFISTREKLIKYRIGRDNISVNKKQNNIVGKYGLVVKMARGWLPFDKKILYEIEEMEK